jgi:SAM-dependent methyltransferase
MGYQPVRTDGEDVGGERSCADRYEFIAKYLEDQTGPFTVLDIGANLGYFSQRLTEDFDCYVTAIDNNPDLWDVQSDRISIINRRVTSDDLRQLPRHDIVLALSVLHHFPDWPEVLWQVRCCRKMAFVEVPAPNERWMKYAVARKELVSLHKEAKALADFDVGGFPRTGRDGVTYSRTMFGYYGNLKPFTGKVFAGSGNNSKSLARYGDATLTRTLGYKPFPGSMNVHVGPLHALGPPIHQWSRGTGRNRRAYDIWPAWINGVAGHVIIPTAKKSHPGTLECWAPMKLRDYFALEDGDEVTIEVASNG